VCSIAIEYGADEDEAIAALLHDGPEDQGGAEVINNIRAQFGFRVADIVEGCSDTFEFPKPPWKARKEAYIAHLSSASQSTRLVSAADKLYNARAILNDALRIGDLIWTRFNGRKDGTLWYYRALVECYQAQPDARLNPLVDELNHVVTELEGVAG
jgi:(p)ppGpp synthase/HD superfamily hydrolase